MRIVKPSAEIVTPFDGGEVLRHIEKCGRVCYKSEDKITDDSAIRFVQQIIKRGHESVIEHFSFTAKFIVDRGISHEIVRHRLASFSQESSRYCNYARGDFGSEITVVEPIFFKEGTDNYAAWKHACEVAEKTYFELLSNGAAPQEARSVLPNSLKTELYMTANLREWRHFFKLRTSEGAHPQVKEVAIPLLEKLYNEVPALFQDIVEKNPHVFDFAKCRSVADFVTAGGL